MILMLKKELEVDYVTLLMNATANNDYMKDYDKNKESSYLKYWDMNNLYDCTMSQRLAVTGFEWCEDIYKFDESFVKNSNEESDGGYFLEVDVQKLKTYMDFTMICHFHMKE